MDATSIISTNKLSNFIRLHSNRNSDYCQSPASIGALVATKMYMPVITMSFLHG
jgi:hypothetical protein